MKLKSPGAISALISILFAYTAIATPWGLWIANENDSRGYTRGYILKGISWATLEPTNNNYQWADLDKKLKENLDKGIYSIINVFVGTHSPVWIYADTQRVNKVVLDNDGNSNPPTNEQAATLAYFPDYTDPQYETHLENFLNALASHISGMEPAVRNSIIGIQANCGAGGDPGWWKAAGAPYFDHDENSATALVPYEYEDEEEENEEEKMKPITEDYLNAEYDHIFMAHWVKAFHGPSAPSGLSHMTIMSNYSGTGVEKDQTVTLGSTTVDLRGTGRKMGKPGARYQLPNENHDYLDAAGNLHYGFHDDTGYKVVASNPGAGETTQNQGTLSLTYLNEIDFDNDDNYDKYIRTRAELDGSDVNAGWFNEAKMWNYYWLRVYHAYIGLDACLISTNTASVITRDPNCLPGDEFTNKYAGQKNPATSPGGFCALRQGIDFANTVQFSTGTYGAYGNDPTPPVNSTVQNRLNKILGNPGYFSNRGASCGDFAREFHAGANPASMNDVGVNIFPGNYEVHLYHTNPNNDLPANGGQGWWRVGPLDQPYGRFARSFGSAETSMEFKTHPDLFEGAPLNGRYPVTIRVVYFNEGTGTWDLKYRNTSGQLYTVRSITNTNTGRWVDITETVSNANFSDPNISGADIVLQKTGSSDVKFHMVEVTKNPAPLSRWQLNETSGTSAADANTTSANAGTLNGGFSFSSASVDGVEGKALQFDGTDDQISLDSHVGELSGFSEGSISGWFKTSSSSTQFIYTVTNSSNRFVQIGLNDVGSTYNDERFWFLYSTPAGRRYAYVTDLQVGSSVISKSLNDDKWHFFTVSVSDEKIEIFIDGREQFINVDYDETDGFMDIPDAAYARIGSRYYNSQTSGYFNGSLDDIRVYKQPLTEWHHDKMYQEGAGVLHEWEFEKISGNVAPDTGIYMNSPEEATGTLSGSLDFSTSGVAVGRNGRSLLLDNNGYVDIGNPGAIDGHNSGTFSGWFKSDSTSTQTIFSLTGGSNYVWIGLNNVTTDYSNESFWFLFHNGGTQKLHMYVRNGNGYYTDGEWHHFAVCIGYGGNRIYIDGVRQDITFKEGTSTSKYFTNITGADRARLGAGYWNSNTVNQFDGELDSLQIYKRLLDDEEAEQIMKYTYNLIHQWEFEETGGDEVADTGVDGSMEGAFINVVNGQAQTISSTTGKTGNGINLNAGSTEYSVDLSEHLETLNQYDQVTFSGWFKPHAGSSHTDTAQFLFSSTGILTTQYVAIGINNYASEVTNEKFWFSYRNGGDRTTMYVMDGALNLHDGNWHHFAVVTGDGDNKIYIDGVLQTITWNSSGAPKQTSFFYMDTPVNALIGGRIFPGYIIGAFKGVLDDFRIYGKPLTAGDIDDIYEGKQ